MAEMMIQNIQINYNDQGETSQPVLLLIHGLGCSLKYWTCVFEAEALKQYRILAIDLPGFGLSAKPDTYDYRLASQAAVVYALLQALKIQRVTVIGHSMGGTVAILLAQAHPEIVERLIVIEPNLRANDAHLSREIVRHSEVDFITHYNAFKQTAITTVHNWFVNPDRSDVEEYTQELLKTTPITMYRSARSLIDVTADDAFLDHFQQLPLPKYFLIGEESARIKGIPESFQTSSVHTVIVPGVGHMMMVDNPQLFNQTLAMVLQ